MKPLQVESPTKSDKRIHFVIYAALSVILVLLGLFGYWSFGSSDVLEIKNNPVPIRTIRDHPTADGVVILKVDFCKKLAVPGRVRISFVSTSREIFLPVVEDREGKTCDEREVPILIPHDTPSDTYRVKYYITYRISPVRAVIEEFESLEFVVDESVSN